MLAHKDIPLKHVPGPEGVKGRNSDNTLLKQNLKWAPACRLEDGMRKTVAWVQTQVAKLDEAKQQSLVSSEIVRTEDALLYTGDL